MTSTTQRIAGSVILVFSIIVAACGSSSKSATPSTTSSSGATSTTTTTSPTTTTSTPVALSSAVWPSSTSRVRYNAPTGVARAFALNYLHFVSPVIGQFRQGDARSGEVPIRTTAEGTSLGPVTTVIVRQINGSWWVLGAATPNITLTQPAALATITSPVRLRGTSTAFEASVNVSIRQDDVAKPLVESFLMGGSNGQMGPFNASFPFASPTSGYGAILLYTISPANGHVAEATVIRVRL
ncbi:MAG TPA: Gmad2 immunoglobulin-like domain-containing protein [Acidimicrobiia bacterium]|nr:Gmad2 immunoglobulin-like domain-containing protein [Acidimicrobiia bacterium]